MSNDYAGHLAGTITVGGSRVDIVCEPDLSGEIVAFLYAAHRPESDGSLGYLCEVEPDTYTVVVGQGDASLAWRREAARATLALLYATDGSDDFTVIA